MTLVFLPNPRAVRRERARHHHARPRLPRTGRGRGRRRTPATRAAQPRRPPPHRGGSRGRPPGLERPGRGDPPRDAPRPRRLARPPRTRADGQRRARCTAQSTPDDARARSCSTSPAARTRALSSRASRWRPRRSISASALEAAGMRVDRDRSRRVHRATRGRAAVAHDRARDPQDAAADPRRARARGRHAISPSTAKSSRPGRAAGCASEFLRADLGITGVNFAAADTGTLVLVTNEGNGRFCTTLPRVHVAIMPVEKVIPRLTDRRDLAPVAHDARDRSAAVELRDDAQRSAARR